VGPTYAIFMAFTIGRNKPPLERGISETWLIAVVAVQSVAVLAALVAHDWPHLRLGLDFLALSMWLWGGMFYIWIILLIFYRYNFFPVSPSDITPPHWINMGAMAISTLAGAQLVENAADAPFLASLLPFLKGLTLFHWAVGTWWIPLLLMLDIWRYIVRRVPLRYDPLHWGAVFPLGMFSVATRHMATALDLPFLEPLPWIMFVVALAVWTLAFAGLLWELRKILMPGDPH